jgi:rhamnogalacturonan endolyase
MTDKCRARSLTAFAGIALVLAFLLFASPIAADELFKDDFSSFPVGWLTRPIGQLNGAIQEYHYLPHRGVPLGPWANAICHLDAWAVGEEDGKAYLEQHSVNDQAELMSPLFITGKPEWRDYEVEAKLRPLSLDKDAGLVFRYHTNRHYYVFALTNGTTARLAVRLPLEKQFRVADWRELGTAAFVYDTQRYYQLNVQSQGPAIRAFVDGKLILSADDGELLRGKVGLAANIPARFRDFRVSTSDQARREIDQAIHNREAAQASSCARNPAPRLWKKFATPQFGAGRNARFGDLDGDGVPEMLIGQNIPRLGDNFIQLSCLTAVTFDGKVLWQLGRPDRRNGLLTADTPCQIHDLDGDGKNEVVMVKDFKLQVLEGATGRLRQWTWMPPALIDNHKKPYTLANGDSLAFLDLSGSRRRHEILVKDRYTNFWIMSAELKQLWQGQGQTGHYPYPYDLDGDGHEEIAIGYAVWDRGGHRLWSHDAELHDHADGIAVGSFGPDPKAEPRVYAWGSDEGFLVFDHNGTILKHVRIGHAQSASVGKFRPDLPGLQLIGINFWKNPGIVTLFDHDGNILAQEEPIHSGSPMLPVNWRGDGQEFVLLSGNVREGGMIDGRLERVVMFPDDGHADLAAYVGNVTGDPRDEVILWDQDQVWIYTQDRPVTGKRIYAPIRNPECNESNYRTIVSRPHWLDMQEDHKR